MDKDALHTRGGCLFFVLIFGFLVFVRFFGPPSDPNNSSSAIAVRMDMQNAEDARVKAEEESDLWNRQAEKDRKYGTSDATSERMEMLNAEDAKVKGEEDADWWERQAEKDRRNGE